MNFKKLNEELKKLLIEDVMNEQTLWEMSPHITKLPFTKFREEVLRRYKYKKQRQKLKKHDPDKAKSLFPPLPYENNCLGYLNNNVVITNNCIEHVAKNHPNMNISLWKEFLMTYNPQVDIKVKAKYDGKAGKRWIYKCLTSNNCYGYVLDIFDKANPQMVTVFVDKEANVDNWIKNSIDNKPEEYEV